MNHKLIQILGLPAASTAAAAPAPRPAPATAAAAAAPASATTPAATAAARESFALPATLRRVVDQQSLQGQTVGQYVIPDVVSADAQSLQLHRLTVFQRYFHSLQMCVHRDIDSGDGSVDHAAVLQLYRHGLVAELH